MKRVVNDLISVDNNSLALSPLESSFTASINFWNCVLNVQLLCEKLNIKYAWTTVLDLSDYGDCPFNFVDQTKFIQPAGMITHLQNKGFLMNNDHFPTEAHKEWSKIIKSGLTLD